MTNYASPLHRSMGVSMIESKPQTTADAAQIIEQLEKQETMKVSDITLGDGDILIENPDDSYNRWPVRSCDGQAFHRDRYLTRHGDVEVRWDEKYKVFRVPSLKANRARFSSAKATHCSRWGSE